MNNGHFPFLNELFDEAIQELSPPQFKIYAYIYRKTIGWRKEWDRISHSQYVKNTTLSLPTVKRILKELIKVDKIDIRYTCAQCRVDVEQANDVCPYCSSAECPDRWYCIKVGSEFTHLVSEITHRGQIVTPQVVSEIAQEVGSEFTPQKTIDQKTINKTQLQQESGGSVDASLKDEKPSDYTLLQDMLRVKFRGQFTDDPSISSCMTVLQEWKLDQCEEALSRCRPVLKNPSAQAALNYLVSFLEHPSWNAPDYEPNTATLTSEEEAIKKDEQWVIYCANFRKGWSGVYPTLEAIAQKRKQTVEEVYAEFDLEMELQEYKNFWDGTWNADEL